ncbi:unnamed protein product [Adineta ricciae]|uniref:Uncharacterized protein n=1 Tax=Adineta ricciae TaxID=249248 RepID=A0A815L045_ADIRI|nr:unnamed protein product [Adineta ricciae]
MTRNSLSEESLVRFEQYLSTNPYREYSMNKPYFPRTSQFLLHSTRQIPQQQSSMLAFHQSLNNSKNSSTLDRIAYKLRMKSDLNIDTLRETDARRRRQQRNQQHTPSQNYLNLEASDITSSIFPSTTTTTTKTLPRQPPSTTMPAETMKTLANEDLNGIEGNAVRVGTIDDLVKRFRPVDYQVAHPPIDFIESPSPYDSTNVLKHNRTAEIKSHSHHQQERIIKEPQALTEYRFKTPTLPSISRRMRRESINRQGKYSQPRTRDQYTNTDNPTDASLSNQCPLNSPDTHRQRMNISTNQPQQSSEINLYNKRVQESRDKSLMRTEKQLCVCNKLTIIDPFTSNTDRMDTVIDQFHHQQIPTTTTTTNYIFPPVRPFGYFTKKSLSEEMQQTANIASLSPRHTKKHGITKNLHQVPRHASDTFEKTGHYRTFTGRIKSVDSLSDYDDDDEDNADNSNPRHNTTVAGGSSVHVTLVQNINDDDEL